MENDATKKPEDFVISFGKAYSVKYFIDLCLKELNIKGKWTNKKSLESLPFSSLTKKIVSYCFEELSSLNKFL